jgi:hypothetical protein
MDDDGGIQYWQQLGQQEEQEKENEIREGCETESEATACIVRPFRVRENSVSFVVGEGYRRAHSGN